MMSRDSVAPTKDKIKSSVVPLTKAQSGEVKYVYPVHKVTDSKSEKK